VFTSAKREGNNWARLSSTLLVAQTPDRATGNTTNLLDDSTSVMSVTKTEATLEDLIPVVNRIQDIVFASTSCGTLDLPQVVVVGAQSSGKSSVIELLVRRDFLPRGTGIVTRRPLAISLINDKNEYCEFLHIKDRKFSNFDEVRAEIEKETLRIAGANKGISNVPISLKIHSPHVLDLTVVDLPGVTKVPIGDQPADIERQTKDLVLQYISNPNSIILAVTPANQDIVNSESLKMARSVDPQGKRTLGVLTKLDLMDRGTNALDVLTGHTYPLKLGFIGIVNRSQQDIQENKSLEESLDAEQDFFQSHPAYRSLAHKLGTPFLGKSLNQILMSHIRDRLPDIKARLNTLIGQTEQELANFGQSQVPETREQQGPLILTLMMKFASSFVGSIDGSPVASDLNSLKELGGGARIYQVFNDVFDKSLKEIDPLEQLSYGDVRTAIRNSAGPRASLFVPELAFDLLMKPLIKLLEAPSQRCVELVYEELMKICHSSGSVEFERFPRLQGKLIDTLSKLLNERLGPTASYVSSLIEIQRAYIKTNHSKFISASDAMNAVVNENRQRELQMAKRVSSAVDELEINKLQGNGSAVAEIDEVEESDRSEERIEKGRSQSAAPSSSGIPHTSADVSPNAQKELFLSYFFGKNSQNTPQNNLGPSFSNLSRSSFSSQVPYFNPNTPSNAVPTDKEPEAEVVSELSTAQLLKRERFEAEAAGMDPKERLECDLMFKLIESYFDIVRETVSDQVPKAIMHFLVNYTKSSAQNRLVMDLYKESMFNELLFEDEAVVQERAKLVESLNTYKAAAKVVTEVI